MKKRARHEEHVNHERWLVSYADFITLLFAFFVVMFAVSQVDSNKLGRFVESVNLVDVQVLDSRRFNQKLVFYTSFSPEPLSAAPGVPSPGRPARAAVT